MQRASAFEELASVGEKCLAVFAECNFFNFLSGLFPSPILGSERHSALSGSVNALLLLILSELKFNLRSGIRRGVLYRF